MTRTRWLWVPVLVSMLVFGACGKSKTSASSSTSTTATTVVSESTTASTASSGAALSVATNASLGGKQILVNSAGKTVYMYMPDGTSKTTMVPAGIKANWPAVTASSSSAPVVGSGVDQSKVTVDMQTDGSDQLAYNGHLLYTFVGDSATGDAKGQALGGIWFALTPAGDKVS